MINGLKIPLGKCIDGNIRIIPDEKERAEYCRCYVEKITNDPELKLRYQQELENDHLNEVMNEVQLSPKFIELGIEDCMSSVKVKWTNSLANSMKQNWKKELKGSDFELTNDIDEYCDCVIDEYRKLPLNQVIEDGFNESEDATKIDGKCSKLSEK